MGTLAPLRRIELSDISTLQTPEPKIKVEEDVEVWKATKGYHDYALFLRRLTEAVVDQYLPLTGSEPSSAISRTIAALDYLDHWIDEIPPLNAPQRFGNLAFRTWGRRLEEEADAVLSNMLGSEHAPALSQVKPYFLTSFGSFTRMDYGTGHEAAFGMFLCCLALIRFYQPEVSEERELVLNVFVRYLRLCWRLQDVYRLEPAGSHGVWGLDDSSFLGYIFGSGQLRDQADIPVSAVLHTPLPPTNLYFMSITRIHEVKNGPFHEHSSQLYAIATGVPNWRKVNSGLFKMYEAEVLAKRVVVQHIPLGGILEWDSSAPVDAGNVHINTQAPWLSPSNSGTPLATIQPYWLSAPSRQTQSNTASEFSSTVSNRYTTARSTRRP